MAEPLDPNAPAPSAPPATTGRPEGPSDAQALAELRGPAAVPMLDPATGQRVYVDPDRAHAEFLDHKLQYEEGQTYVVQTREGQRVRVGAAEAAAYSDAHPYTARLGLTRDVAREEQEAKRGTFAGMARTAGEGALDELTLGGAAVVGRALGGEAYQTRRQLDEEINPGSDLAGRGLGLAAGLLVGTGEAAGAGLAARAARGATAGVRGVVRAGEAVEGLARAGAAGLGLAEGGAAARALGGAARAGLEMAAFSGGAEVARQAVHDSEYDAERALAAAVRGAEEGAVLGGGLSLLGSGLRAAGSRAAEAVETQAAKLKGSALREELARAEALRSTGATGADLREFAEGARLNADGQRMADRILAAEREVGVPLQQWRGVEAVEFFGGKAREAGARIGKALELAEAGAPGMPNALRQVVSDAADRALALEGSAAYHTEGKAAWRYLERVSRELDGQGAGAIFKARAELDGLLRNAGPGEAKLRAWQGELVEQLEVVVKGTLREAELTGGPGARGLAQAYEAARAEYRDAIKLQQLYENGVQKGTVEGLGGLKSLLWGGGPVSAAGGAVGAAAGGLIAGPAGAFVGRELGALAARPGDVALRRAVRERGSGVAAQALRDLGTKPAGQVATTAARGLLGLDVAADPVAGALARGARALAAPVEGAVPRTERGANYAAAAGRAARRAARAADPAVGAAFATEAATRLRRSEQEARRGADTAARAGVAALAAARSPDALDGPLVAAARARAEIAGEALTAPETPPPGTPYAAELPSSQSHADVLAGRRAVLGRPERVLSLAAKGRLTGDQIALLTVAMPVALERARQAAADGLAGARATPSVPKLVQATLLLGTPAAPELQPAALQSVQAVLARVREANAQTGSGKSGGPRGGPMRAVRAEAAASGLPGDV